jgi:hypothetical protein
MAAKSIILHLTREESIQIYKIMEPIAMARPLFLNILLGMKADRAGTGITLQMKRNTADQIRLILGPIASAQQIFLNTNDAITAAGGVISSTL